MSKSGKIYKVLIDEEAAGFIESQAVKIQRQIMKRVNSLAENPELRGQPIKNSIDTFKIRSGDYRIAYRILKDKVVVLVVRIGNRSDFYKYYDR